jgi:hypothetical protein
VLAASASGGLGLTAGVPPRHPVAAASGGLAPGIQQACDELGQASECFNSPGTSYLNVGEFFDDTGSSTSAHYILKLFRNETGDSLRLTGMGFYARTSNPAANVFQAAGAIVMGSDVVFPRSDALVNLTTVGIVAAPLDTMTCVGFEDAIDSKGRLAQPVLGPDECAWLVLRFPELAEGVRLQIRVDSDATDLDCDFLTPDAGEHWYRPDPRSTPHYDWEITAYTAATASRPVSAAPTWSLVKSLYR